MEKLIEICDGSIGTFFVCAVILQQWYHLSHQNAVIVREVVLSMFSIGSWIWHL
jgi:hypothetical protein